MGWETGLGDNVETLRLIWALAAIAAVQLVTAAAVLGLGRRSKALSQALPFLVSGAAGVLLATACLDLLPAAVQAAARGGDGVWGTLLITLLVLFCVQAGAHRLFQNAAPDSPVQDPAASSMAHAHGPSAARGAVKPASLLLGSALHSTVDGFAIVAAFAAGRRAGWGAALAVGLHELPHRMGDFALLIHGGMPRRRAAQLAVAAGAMALVGGLVVALCGQQQGSLAWLLPVSAATFLYIALVDLIPELRTNRPGRGHWWEILCLLGGAGLMAVLIRFQAD